MLLLGRLGSKREFGTLKLWATLGGMRGPLYSYPSRITNVGRFWQHEVLNWLLASKLHVCLEKDS